MAKIQPLRDLQNNLIAPVTHERAVYDSDGVRLASKLQMLNATKGYLGDGYVKETIDLTSESLPLRRFLLRLNGMYGQVATTKHLLMDASPDDYIQIKTGNSDTLLYFLSNANREESGGTIPAVGNVVELAAASDYLLKVPAGSVCAAINTGEDMSTAPLEVVRYRKKVADSPKKAVKVIPCAGLGGISASSTTGTLETSTGVAFIRNICFRVEKDKTYVAECDYPGYTEVRVALLSTVPHIGCPFTGGYVMTSGLYGLYNGEHVSYKYTAPADGYFLMTAYDNNLSVYEVEEAVPAGWNRTIEAEVKSIRANDSFEEVDIDTLPSIANAISWFSIIQNSDNSFYHKLVPVKFGQVVKVTPGANNAALAFLTDDYNEIKKPASFSSNYPFRRFDISETTLLTVPADAKYLYFTTRRGSNDYTPAYIGVSVEAKSGDASSAVSPYEKQAMNKAAEESARGACISLSPVTVQATDAGWEIPATIQERNFVKKIKQFAEIKWTPKTSVPGNHFTWQAGTEYTGIPYSSNAQFFKIVGVSVSLETFMTAVNNPYSLFYTESIKSNRNVSIWGYQYNNSNGYCYYGMVCNTFVSAIHGLGYRILDGQILRSGWKARRFIPLTQMKQIDFDLLKIGDIITNGSHTAVVMGIRRDSSGNVITVQMAEEFPYEGIDTVRVVRRSAENMISYVGSANEGSPEVLPDDSVGKMVCRYNGFFANTKYTPSPYVAIDDEEQQTVVYNNDICTFAGDKATFGYNELVVLNYNLTGSPTHAWTGIEVYKDDVLIQTYALSSIDQSALPEGQRGHALNLGKDLASGSYKARMTDGTNYSDCTYWEVLRSSATVTKLDDGGYRIDTTDSVNGVCLGAMYDGNGGKYFSQIAIHELTYNDKSYGHITIYPKEEIADYGYTVPENMAICLVLNGKYGRTLSAPVVLD